MDSLQRTDRSSAVFLDISLIIVSLLVDLGGEKGRPKEENLPRPPLVLSKVDTLSECAQ